MENTLNSFCKKYASKSAILSQGEIDSRRRRVLKIISDLTESSAPLTVANIDKFFTDKVLTALVKAIDDNFFNGEINTMFTRNKCCFSICMENRCSRTGGKCWLKGGKIIIKLSSKVFKSAFESTRQRRHVGNVPCTSILECLLLILEHELVHAMVFCDCKSSGNSDATEHKFGEPATEMKTNARTLHSKTFMAILNNRFGHTDFLHHIFGYHEIDLNRKVYTKSDIKIGDKVILRTRLNMGYLNTQKEMINYVVEVMKFLPNNRFQADIIDAKVLKLIKGPKYDPAKDTRHPITKISYKLIFSKMEGTTWDPKPTDTPVKSPEKPKVTPPVKSPEKPKVTPPVKSPVKKTQKVSLCNKRNPEPPCPSGMVVRKRPNGADCCFKTLAVKKTVKKQPTVAKPKEPVKSKVVSPKREIDLLDLDPDLKFAYKPHSLEYLEDSTVDFKKLKPTTQVYINTLKRYKYSSTEPLNSIGIFPSDIPNDFILKVGVKYVLVYRSGASYVRYGLILMNIPEPSRDFEPLVAKPKEPEVAKPMEPVVAKPKEPVVSKPKEPVTVKSKVVLPSRKIDLLELDPNLKFAYKPQSLESLQGSIVDFKKLKPSTQVYINKLKRLKYNSKEPLNSIGIFPSDIPNEFILKVGVKYVLVYRSGASYVRYGLILKNIPNPLKDFEQLVNLGKCNKRNPTPPCPVGMVVKKRPNGSECCYKS